MRLSVRSLRPGCVPSPGIWTETATLARFHWSRPWTGHLHHSNDPRDPARLLATVPGLLRHLSAPDGATEVPAPGLLGPPGAVPAPRVLRRRDRRPAGRRGQAVSCQRPAAAVLCHLVRAHGPHHAADLRGAGPVVRRRRRGRRPAHRPRRQARPDPAGPAAPRRRGGAERLRRERVRLYDPPDVSKAFFRTDRGDRVSYRAANHTFTVLRQRLG